MLRPRFKEMVRLCTKKSTKCGRAGRPCPIFMKGRWPTAAHLKTVVPRGEVLPGTRKRKTKYTEPPPAAAWSEDPMVQTRTESSLERHGAGMHQGYGKNCQEPPPKPPKNMRSEPVRC
ncbi:hypothetical protein NDU88_010678 [Pleurodeles waltl]|uniref:Uncharacterized protein n=1 Tax=Pleurodeles waltl TaxID=8319 RepID=A0AAV7S1V7_PLEWA|nr:hypothetical protein NDU88_010678 [Pleurodeles waltl]